MPITEDYVKYLMEQNASMTEQISQLTSTVKELNQTIKKLQEQLKMNSKNSSKPPSSDGLKKPPVNKNQSLRQTTGKKQGGQAGHKGTNLSVIANPNQVEKHMALECESCPYHDTCLEHACIKETRHVIDAVVDVNVVAHEQVVVVDCPLHGGKKQGSFPKHVKATVQYGPNLNALVVAFTTVGAVSVNRTHEILGSVFNIPLATGTISNMVSRCASSLTGIMEWIRQQMLNLELIHCDETGTRVDGKTIWVHNASNTDFTHLSISKKRGKEGMDEAKILPFYHGITVHDCWSSYWKYENLAHAVCSAHLLRELNGVEQNHPEQTWATEFKKLLLSMKKVRDKAFEEEKTGLSYYHLHKFDKQYDEIILKAYEENPLPVATPKKRGKKKKGKVLCLINRLDNYKESVCLFIKNLCVPFDNNQAERDIRMIKVKNKVSGCFRSMEGAQEYLTIMSYVGTAKKHGINAYKAIQNAIAGTPEITFD